MVRALRKGSEIEVGSKSITKRMMRIYFLVRNLGHVVSAKKDALEEHLKEDAGSSPIAVKGRLKYPQ